MVEGSGWLSVSSGGYSGSGCGGGFATHWITSSTVDCCSVAYSTFTWRFSTKLSSGSCQVSVYIPDGTTTEVGGHPARYTVYTGSGQSVGTFELDQRDNMGRWLPGGTFTDTGSSFEVQLDNQTSSGSHQVAASALKVSCST